MIWFITAAIALLLLCMLTAWLVGERGHLSLPSTRRIFREYGIWRIVTPRIWHFYFYGRWPRLYIGMLVHLVFGVLARLGHRGRHWLADRYHGKVLTLEHAKSIITVEQDIPLRDLDQIVPYPIARKMVLQSPLDVVVFDCPCRLTRSNPCQPVQVCLIVGQPFADLVLEHHPKTSRRLTQQEALALLESEHSRGHVHAAWFKDACLDRFFAICNCCKCCCEGIDAMTNYGIPMMTSSGYVATVDAHVCQGCGTCQTACPFDAVDVHAIAQVDVAKCMGCGVCIGQCPADAVSLALDATKGKPLDVRQLANA